MSFSALRSMEQYSQYLMWMNKSKRILNVHFQDQFNSSWEEQAFMDDAVGPLGGFAWPPRSYSCSFCKREFRSAQALGGHMNVHRRDRARLKQQSLTPQNEVLHHPQNCKSLDIASYPSQVCFTDSNNTNPSSVSPSRVSVSAMSNQENFSEHTYMSPFCSATVSEDRLGRRFNDSDSKTAFGKNARKEDFTILNDSDSKPVYGKDEKREDFVFLGHDDCVETSLSMGLNLNVFENQPSGFGGDHHEVMTCKRHKTRGSLEDLDLELRLGDPPKVK
ncbi:probable transcriptional regulator RABBIT EARS [Camellia sinensis]|uniref:C2H2-type domain-containing protein n=1 Tax=Camellia sinensis var. sinensis TaxID=542762 RepID=A0A4S4ELS5_CAMSN|nr:probable transcriptional regulator RABBIT EARS [Camellia sinensis]THG17075.1 hypothetical protein TEA_004181 [Camellia sinensis var. sinensis]